VTRLQAIEAVGNPHIKDTGLIGVVIASSSDPNTGVRAAAIHALSRIGVHAVVQAEPELRKILTDPSQPAIITSAARKALRDAGLSVE
jgi:vesicle coat complex subunit